MNYLAANINMAAVQAAAAIAAQINASIAAKPSPLGAAPVPPPKTHFEEIVDINFARNRGMLVRGATQTQIHKETGACIVTKGRYKPIGDNSSEDALHLIVSASSQEALDHALEKINAIKGNQHVKAFRCSSKCIFGLDCPPGFDLVTECQGPNGSFFDHITKDTSAYLAIRGRGAPPPFNADYNEPLQVYIGADTEPAVQAATALVENLLVAVRGKITAFIAAQPPAIPTFPAPQGHPHYPNEMANMIQNMAVQAIHAAHALSGYPNSQQAFARPPAPLPYLPPQQPPMGKGSYNSVAPPSFIQAQAREALREAGVQPLEAVNTCKVPLWEQEHLQGKGSAQLPFQPPSQRSGGYDYEGP